MDALLILLVVMLFFGGIAASAYFGWQYGLKTGAVRQLQANAQAIAEAQDRAIAAAERESERERHVLFQATRLKEARDHFDRESQEFWAHVNTGDIDKAISVYGEMNTKLAQDLERIRTGDLDRVVIPVPPKGGKAS